jgi:hypothetical protein
MYYMYCRLSTDLLLLCWRGACRGQWCSLFRCPATASVFKRFSKIPHLLWPPDAWFRGGVLGRKALHHLIGGIELSDQRLKLGSWQLHLNFRILDADPGYGGS